MKKEMMIQWSWLLAFLWHAHVVQGQLQESASGDLAFEKDPRAMTYAGTITESDLKNYLEILASDALEGRKTGSRGQKMAAAFISHHFKDNELTAVVPDGIRTSYQQTFDLYKSYYGQVYIANEQHRYRHMEDLLFYGDINIPEEQSLTLRFVGEGEVNDYQELEIEGQIVAFFASSRGDRSRKIRIAKDHGALGALVINTDNEKSFQDYLNKYSHFFDQSTISEDPPSPGETLIMFGPPELVANLLSTSVEKMMEAMDLKSDNNPLKKIRPASVKVRAHKVLRKLTTENILGFIEGSDKKDEIIVLTAHYDHEGVNNGSIYNGADDDGSGTVAILEIAQAFAKAKSEGHGPRRSLLFMAVTAEEEGLLGSSYYVENPVFPLGNTVANLNIDMIGRVDNNHNNDQEYVYVIGSDRLSQELHDINEQVNRAYTQLNLNYKYNDKDDPNRYYYRSDHYNFAKHNIPIIFYFNGVHPDYHQPSDTADKIRYDLLKKRAELVFYTAWELANREQRIKLN